MPLPFRLIYHEGYNLDLGEHVFPAQKYRGLRDRLLHTGFVAEGDFIEPQAASDEDILLVHSRDWVRKLRNGALTPQEILLLEIPYSQRMVEAFWLAAGGTILAARLALSAGMAFHIGGGFHHAFPDHGEGFCAINDIAVAIRRVQRDGAIRRAMVVDCDVHHGNGTAAIFAGDDSVFTLSIHQLHNYPSVKPLSDLDIHLPDGAGDQQYLDRLRNGLAAALSMFRPDLMIYVAGADPFRQDRLGGLALTFDGLRARDRLVLESAHARRIPVAIVLAGGYAENTEDTIGIHAATAEVAKTVCGAGGS